MTAAAMITPSGDLMSEPRWYPGFFSAVLHRVANTGHAFDFHGQHVAWSLCGRPVALVSAKGGIPRCERCGFKSVSTDDKVNLACQPINQSSGSAVRVNADLAVHPMGGTC